MTIPKIKYWTPIWLSTARYFGSVRTHYALERLIARLAEELGSEEAAWRYVMDSRMDPGVEGGEPGFGYRLRHRGQRLEEWLEEQAQEEAGEEDEPDPGKKVELLLPGEVAEALCVSRRRILAWCRSGYISAIKAGRDWRIPSGELERLLRGAA